MWVKSALMTTATPLDNTGQPIQRAGVTTPRRSTTAPVTSTPAPAFDPGLVYDSDANDWFAYGCAIGQLQLDHRPVVLRRRCRRSTRATSTTRASPWRALAGTQTVTRTITNISTDQASQYKPTIQAPAGFTASVNVDKLHDPAAAVAKSFKVTLTRTTAPLGQWAFGSLTWTDKRGHSVRSSIALQPVAAAAPTELTVHGTSGSQQASVRAGYTGTLNAPVAGLVPAHVDTVAVPKTQSANMTVSVPAGTKFVRFATYDADYPAGTDVDIAVTRGGTAVGSSGGATAEESVSLDNPPAGDYVVKVTYFAGASATLPINLNSFVLGSTAAGNLTATPATQSVTSGSTVPVTLAWTRADSRHPLPRSGQLERRHEPGGAHPGLRAAVATPHHAPEAPGPRGRAPHRGSGAAPDPGTGSRYSRRVHLGGESVPVRARLGRCSCSALRSSCSASAWRSGGARARRHPAARCRRRPSWPLCPRWVTCS